MPAFFTSQEVESGSPGMDESSAFVMRVFLIVPWGHCLWNVNGAAAFVGTLVSVAMLWIASGALAGRFGR